MNLPTAHLLLVAAELANSDLNPEYAIPEAKLIAAAVANDDPTELVDVAERLHAYADGVGLHGLGDDPELVRDLLRWHYGLRGIVTAALTGSPA